MVAYVLHYKTEQYGDYNSGQLLGIKNQGKRDYK